MNLKDLSEAIPTTNDPEKLSEYSRDQSGRIGVAPVAIIHPVSNEDVQGSRQLFGVNWAISRDEALEGADHAAVLSSGKYL